MVKYRFLTDEELAELETEFKQFLISNGLHDDEWRLMNTSAPEKAQKVVGLFSDLILDKVFSQTKYLYHHSNDKIKVFSFTEKKAVMIGLDYEGSGFIPEEEQVEFIKSNLSDFKIYSASKEYPNENRNAEVYSLVKNGAEKVDSTWFEFLSSLK